MLLPAKLKQKWGAGGFVDLKSSIISNPAHVPNAVQSVYVKLMMDVIGRGLVTASTTDEVVQREIRGYAVGTIISMQVFPHIAQFFLRVEADYSLKRLTDLSSKADLTIRFKHLRHAFLVFSFQESTARAFANDRMIVDGDLSAAIRLVRCLNRMESLILPKIIAEHAVKSYPSDLQVMQKLRLAGRIYTQIAQSYFTLK